MKRSKFNAKAACIETLKAEGWLGVADMERHIFGGLVTLDFLGGKNVSGIDVMAYHPNRPTLGVQVTTASHGEEHYTQLASNREIIDKWMRPGHQLELWLYPDREDRDGGDIEPQRIVLTRKWFGMKEHDVAPPTWKPLNWEGKP